MPRHTSVLVHPTRKKRLARVEREPFAAAHPSQLDSQMLGQQATQGEPQSRARSISPEVIPDPGTEALLARRGSVHRILLWGDANVDERQCLPCVAALQWN